MVGLDLCELLDNGLITDVDPTEACERFSRGFMLVLLDQKPRGFGKDQHAGNENDSPYELDSDRDSVGTSVIAVLGCIVDDGGHQQANSDGQLIGTDNGTTNPLRRGFGLIEGDLFELV